jgi:hypothetical protein
MGTLPVAKWPKNKFLPVFLRKILGKIVATLGTLPVAKWPKNKFLSVFLRKILGIIVAIGSGHFGDPP